MTLVEAAKSCFSNYMDLSGRASRSEFWKFVLVLLLGSILLTVINSVIFGPTVEQVIKVSINSANEPKIGLGVKHSYDGGWFGLIFSIATLLPFLAVACRRLHDIGKAGWWMLFPVPFFVVGAGVILAITVLPTGSNQTGAMNMSDNINAALITGLAIFASIVTVIVWLARKGQPELNSHGPNPLEVLS